IWTPAWTLVAGALALGAFDFISSGSRVAKRGLISQKPPVYGTFTPSFARLGVIALALAAVAGVIVFMIARRDRMRSIWVLLIATALLLSFAAAVAVVNGSTKAYTDPLERKRPADYQIDVHVVRELGVRTFIREHPTLLPQLKSVHSRTHPPGPVIVFSVLQSVFPKHLVPRAVALAFLSSLILIPTWFLTRKMYGERAASYAVLLLAVAPAPAIFGFTSMDAVFATLLATAGVLLFFGLGPDGDVRLAFVAGLVAGFMTILTYGVAFVVAAGLAHSLITRKRRAGGVLAAAAAGGVVALIAMRLVLGYDLSASFRAGYKILADESDRSYLYWIFGNPAVWLTFAGLPIAALSVRELIERRPQFLIALFIPLLLIDLNHKFAAETERIGQFAYPFIAAAAGGWLARWEGSERRPGAVALMVTVTALQAILLEALFYTFW
ncbi:MAG: glycosyltransferase family 39 protein, partial [Actinobacteria bacterium]|nr:glycosyltransferase family 39 protein [Actinomycetota bacterium]